MLKGQLFDANFSRCQFAIVVMATAPDPKTFKIEDLDFYSLLQVGRNATRSEIKAAYLRQSLKFHPDKTQNSETEEIMKKLNKAKSVLLDEEARTEYDDTLDETNAVCNPDGFLPSGKPFSAEFLAKYEKWRLAFTKGQKKGLGNSFEITLQRDIHNLLSSLKISNNRELSVQSHKVPPCKMPPHKVPPKTQSLPAASNSLQRLMHLSSDMLKDSFLHGSINQLRQRLISIQNCASFETINTIFPLSHLPDNDLKFLFSFFTGKDGANRDEMLYQLTSIIPVVDKINPLTTKYEENSFPFFICSKCRGTRMFSIFGFSQRCKCFRCNKYYCKKCQPQQITSARLVDAQDLCQECIDYIHQLDADDWTTASLKFLKVGTIEATAIAFGCLTMALMNSTKTFKPVLKIAQNMHDNGLPELAMPLVSAVLQQSSDNKELLHAYMLTASILKSMAEQPGNDADSKFELFQAAKEANTFASSLVDSSMDVPDLELLSKRVDLAIVDVHEQKKQENEHLIEKYYQKLVQLWNNSDFEKILKFLSNEAADDHVFIALHKFITYYEKFIDKMKSTDQAALFFFRSIHKMHNGDFSSALIDIEKAAWSSHRGDWLSQAVMDTLFKIIQQYDLPIFLTKSFVDSCMSQNLLDLLANPPIANKDRCFSLMFASDEELLPSPLTANWPDLHVVGLKVKGHKKFEQAVVSKIQNKSWNEWEAGMAYIDYIAACSHVVEIIFCMLKASLWIAKYLQVNPDLTNSVKFATMKVLLHLLKIIFYMGKRKLSAGMQLYVFRLSLGALLHTLKLHKSLATKGASELVVALIRNILHFCRFCPFWQSPPVSLSEAVLLKIKIDRFHGEFIVRLQDVDQKQRPITEAELRYQLYENDLRCLYPLQDSTTAHERAMEEMLLEKGWNWNDVASLMTSPLSPRDSEGWLIRSPKLGVPMEFHSLKGFVLNLGPNNTSIELLVEPANEKQGKIGLFSQDDVITMMAAIFDDDAGPLFFSLDPPSAEFERFHPFQQFRYDPQKLQDTPLLHTMFETDYLLKSFSVGSEVSSKPPFKQRPCKEGLTKGLPFHLAEVLKSIPERGGLDNSAHRFWIQADKLSYEQTDSDSERIELRLGEVEMTIRTHPLIHGLDGKDQDTKNDHDSDSAEAKFASDLTRAYDEISSHFPMFGRLKELAKLFFLARVARGHLSNLKEKANGQISKEAILEIRKNMKSSKDERVRNAISDMKKNIGAWPKAEDSATVSSANKRISDMVLQQPGVYTLSQSDKREINELTIKKLKEVDEEILTQVVDSFMDLTKQKIYRSTLERHVREWLRSQNSYYSNSILSPEYNLQTLICSNLPPITDDEIKRLVKELYTPIYDRFKRFTNVLIPKLNVSPNACDWVPAALIKEESDDCLHMCYGGVIIAPEFKQTTVPPFRGKVNQIKIVSQTKQYNPTLRQRRSYHSHAYRASNCSATPAANGTGGGSSGGGGGGSSSGGGGTGFDQASAAAFRGNHGSDDDDDNDNQTTTNLYKQVTILALLTWVGDLIRRFNEPQAPRRHQRRTDDKELLVFSQVLVVKEYFRHFDSQTKLSQTKLDKRKLLDIQFSRALINPPQKIGNVPVDAYGQVFTKDTRNVIYCIRCTKSKKMYIGRTKNEFDKRIKKHFRDISKGDSDTKRKLISHFNSEEHSVNDIEVFPLEKLPDDLTNQEVNDHETYWMLKFNTVQNGLNMKVSSARMRETWEQGKGEEWKRGHTLGLN
jgi:hypothetical protein